MRQRQHPPEEEMGLKAQMEVIPSGKGKGNAGLCARQGGVGGNASLPSRWGIDGGNVGLPAGKGIDQGNSGDKGDIIL